MSRRLLLMAGGGGSFALPPIGVPFLLSSAPMGSWGYVDPRAFHYNGATYYTWTKGTNGDIGVSRFVHASGLTYSTVIESGFERDDHSTPSVIVRSSDHRVVVAYSKHNGAAIRRWISTSPEDVSAGSIAQGVGEVTAATYPTLVQLDGVTDAPVWWFYRDRPGGAASTPAQIELVTSTDGLSTWGSHAVLFHNTTHTPYWRITSDWDRYIHVFVTSAEPNEAGAFVYHFYIDGADGSLHKSDGTVISTAWPIDYTDCTLVTDGIAGGGYCLPAGACVDAATGYPAVLVRVATDSGQTDNSMRVARWTGSAWQVDEVTTTGGTLPGFVYSPSGAIHPTDPDLVYVAKMVSGKAEMYRYTSADGGGTWQGIALTSGSAVHNVYPEVPRNAAAGLAVIWPRGTIASDTDYDFATEGWAP